MELHAVLLVVATVLPIDGTFLGCYQDNVKRLMADYRMDLHDFNSPAKCIYICRQLGYQYAGVEAGQQCFCSKYKPSRNSKTNIEDCQRSCPNSGEKCGGTWRLAVYFVHSYLTIEDNGTYIGCYEDATNRIVNEFRIDFFEINNPRRCIHVCTAMGYLYAGMENGNECFCGNTKPADDKKKEENECQTSCPYSQEKCGGAWRISVYRTIVDSDTVETITDGSLCRNSLGCFEDSEHRILSDYFIPLFDINSPKKCYYICRQLRYDYAAVQMGMQCFCGNQRPSESYRKDNECQTSCPNSVEKCGGGWRNYVYSTELYPLRFVSGSRK